MRDILAHADELAQRFKDYELDPADDISTAELELRWAALASAAAEKHVAEAVNDARSRCVTWAKIDAQLGMSAQAAQRRYTDPANA